MRVNIYAEEMTDRIEIIGKTIEGRTYTGLRLYLELPATLMRCRHCRRFQHEVTAGYCGAVPSFVDGPRTCQWEPFQCKAPFLHHADDDDSSAITFWGKRDLREILKKALVALDEHYKV